MPAELWELVRWELVETELQEAQERIIGSLRCSNCAKQTPVRWVEWEGSRCNDCIDFVFHGGLWPWDKVG